MFETHVLAALSGEVASFPYTTSEFDGKGSIHEINDLRYHCRKYSTQERSLT